MKKRLRLKKVTIRDLDEASLKTVAGAGATSGCNTQPSGTCANTCPNTCPATCANTACGTYTCAGGCSPTQALTCGQGGNTTCLCSYNCTINTNTCNTCGCY